MTKDEALDLALDALKNVAVTGPDDDGLVWINLPGNGTTGKAILRVGKAGLIAAQCAKLYEEQRTKAITALTAIKQARSAPVQEQDLREELDATNRQVEILSDALAESRREVAALKINAALDKKAENARELGLDYEPVCNKDPQGCWNVRCQLGKKCKNAPAQQEPLTDEQIDRLWSQSLADTEGETYLPLREFARAIEAKLKEQNT